MPTGGFAVLFLLAPQLVRVPMPTGGFEVLYRLADGSNKAEYIET